MVARRSEQLCTAVCPLEVQLNVVLPGNRDAAVHLDGLGGDGAERLAGDTRANAALVGVGSATASFTTALADCTST